MSVALVAEADLDELALAAIGGGLDADDDEVEQDFNPTDPSTTEPIEDPATAEAERQTEKATLATLGNPDHPNFAQEMKLLDRDARDGRVGQAPARREAEKALRIHRPEHARSAQSPKARPERRLERPPHSHLHRIRRHARRTSGANSRPTSNPRMVPRERLAVYKGSTSLEERQEIKEAFNADPAVNPVRILLATDAAREGLNLQKYCFNLFHYDIPWNPARLEQRNGRIDRKLQPAPTVYCRYFLYENREEDTILRRIVEKTETIYRELGGFGTVLDKNLIQTLRRRGIERSRAP